MPFKNITAEVSAQFVFPLFPLWHVILFYSQSRGGETKRKWESRISPWLKSVRGNLFLSGQPIRGWVHLRRCNWATCACVRVTLFNVINTNWMLYALKPFEPLHAQLSFSVVTRNTFLSSFYQSLLSPFSHFSLLRTPHFSWLIAQNLFALRHKRNA